MALPRQRRPSRRSAEFGDNSRPVVANKRGSNSYGLRRTPITRCSQNPASQQSTATKSRRVKRSSKAMTSEDNGNVGLLKPTSSSNEDLSEYTDADESISAPTEFLAEFLSAVMLKDYETALKYCKLILQYEPNNATAKEFYPLILEKLHQMNTEEDDSSDEGEDDVSEDSSSSSSDSDSNSSSSDGSSEGQDEEDEEGMGVCKGDKQSKGSSDGDATTGSYSSLEDDEVDTDQLSTLAAKYQVDNVNLGNGNKIYETNYVVSNFEEKLSNAPGNGITKVMATGSNLLPFGTSSDSESPTEPVSQQTVQLLRGRVVPTQQ